jgi:hypothetical protein
MNTQPVPTFPLVKGLEEFHGISFDKVIPHLINSEEFMKDFIGREDWWISNTQSWLEVFTVDELDDKDSPIRDLEKYVAVLERQVDDELKIAQLNFIIANLSLAFK